MEGAEQIGVLGKMVMRLPMLEGSNLMQIYHMEHIPDPSRHLLSR